MFRTVFVLNIDHLALDVLDLHHYRVSVPRFARERTAEQPESGANTPAYEHSRVETPPHGPAPTSPRQTADQAPERTQRSMVPLTAARAGPARQRLRREPAPRASAAPYSNPSSATASRSSPSSAAVRSIRAREKSLISSPSTTEKSPPAQVTGNPATIPSGIP